MGPLVSGEWDPLVLPSGTPLVLASGTPLVCRVGPLWFWRVGPFGSGEWDPFASGEWDPSGSAEWDPFASGEWDPFGSGEWGPKVLLLQKPLKRGFLCWDVGGWAVLEMVNFEEGCSSTFNIIPLLNRENIELESDRKKLVESFG
uniref:Uncharacterized protein n=1 Tax=Ditylenchus dipsaci TaxID=166011 RepID=A0A915CTP5_9BILA